MKQHLELIAIVRSRLAQRLLDLTKVWKTRESALANTSLQLGRMFIGKAAGELGSANPYPESLNPASPKLEPPADGPGDYQPSLPGDHVADAKSMRAGIEFEILVLTELRRKIWPRQYGTVAELYFDRALCELQAAKMWLGEHMSVMNKRGGPAIGGETGSAAPVDQVGSAIIGGAQEPGVAEGNVIGEAGLLTSSGAAIATGIALDKAGVSAV